MRGLIQRQKQNSTLKNISEPNASKLEGQQNVLSKDQKHPTTTNIRQWISTKRQQDELLKQKHPFSIFVVPTNKLQSKILNSLIPTKQNNQEKQERSKSQRVGHLPAKNMTQFSHRKRIEADISRKIERERKGKLSLMSNKNSQSSYNQLQNLQKRNQNNLIENIANLIKAERDSISLQQSELDQLQKNLILKQDRRCYQNIIKERISDQMLKQYNRKRKQQAAIKFKQNIKNKLSRRHIYHTLKHKSEVWNKIRLRTHHYSPTKTYQAEQQSLDNKIESPLHYGLTKQYFRNLPFNQLKDTNISFYQAYEELRVQSKPARIEVESPTKIKQDTKKKFRKESKQEDYHYKNKTITDFNIKKMSNPQVQLKYDKKNQTNTFKKRMSEQQGLDRHKYITKTQEVNIFRQLTPWHGDDPE